jgi:hypothetical protein
MAQLCMVVFPALAFRILPDRSARVGEKQLRRRLVFSLYFSTRGTQDLMLRRFLGLGLFRNIPWNRVPVVLNSSDTVITSHESEWYILYTSSFRRRGSFPCLPHRG